MNNITTDDVRIRLERLRLYMRANNLDFYVVFTADPHLSEYISPADAFREYITGFTGSAGTLLVTLNEAYIWVDGRYFIQAEQEIDTSIIKIMKMGEKGVPTLSNFLIEKCALLSSPNIGLDGCYISQDVLLELNDKLSAKATIDCNAIICEEIWPERPSRVFNEIRIVDQEHAGVLASEKLSDIRKIINNTIIDTDEDYTMIISDLCSIMWITNLRGSDIRHVPVAYSYLLVNRDDSVIYLNNAVVDDYIRDYLKDNGIKCRDYCDFYSDISLIGQKSVLIDVSSNNAYIHDIVRKNNNIIEIEDADIIRKDIKNQTEIECMRHYHVCDAASVIRFIHRIKKLVSIDGEQIPEWYAGLMMDEIRTSHRYCYDLSFDTISAYGKNAALPHYQASEDNSSNLKAEGFYLIDCGGHYPSCTTDITRTIALGGLTDYEKECYTAVLKGNLALMSAVFMEGCRGENLDILAREPIWRLGIDYRHGTGHGIGCELSVHEGPLAIRTSINKKRLSPKLMPGMIVSDEPGIYLENKFGIRLENELLVVEKNRNEWGTFLGFESLTLVPFERDAIIPSMLSRDEIDCLNSYHQNIYNIVAPLLADDEKEWLYEQTRPIF